MSDSNWRTIYTTGLIGAASIAALLAAWLLWSTHAQHLEIEQEATKAANAYADTRNIATKGECLDIPLTESGDCITEEREASKEGQRKERDLEAQQIMAAWTRTVGIATVIGMAFGIIGLGLIFVTFRETRRAAHAGFKANEIALEATQKQLRAYIGFQPGTIRNWKVQSEIKIGVKNFGQTPAQKITARTIHRAADGRAVVRSHPFGVIDPQGSLEALVFEGKISPSEAWKIGIVAKYTDAFGHTWVKRTVFYTDGNLMDQATKELHMGVVGNSASERQWPHSCPSESLAI